MTRLQEKAKEATFAPKATEVSQPKSETPKADPKKDALVTAMKNGGVTSEQAIKILHPEVDLTDKVAKNAAGRSVRRILRDLCKKLQGTITKTEGRGKIYQLAA